MKRKNAGQIRIIEAFLAVLIVFSSLTISSSINIRQDFGNHDHLSSTGLQALINLDSDGSLGEYIDDEDWAGLQDAINLALPSGISYNMTIYDMDMKQINSDVISNAGFSSQDILFVEHICATQSSNFQYYIIHLHLAAAS